MHETKFSAKEDNKSDKKRQTANDEVILTKAAAWDPSSANSHSISLKMTFKFFIGQCTVALRRTRCGSFVDSFALAYLHTLRHMPSVAETANMK